eukprot:3959838-Alexandrium_andersonii.AAC.1
MPRRGRRGGPYTDLRRRAARGPGAGSPAPAGGPPGPGHPEARPCADCGRLILDPDAAGNFQCRMRGA